MTEPGQTTRIAVGIIGADRTDLGPAPRPLPPTPVGPVYAPPPGIDAAVVAPPAPEAARPLVPVAADSPFAPPVATATVPARARAGDETTVAHRADVPPSGVTVVRRPSVPTEERTVVDRAPAAARLVSPAAAGFLATLSPVAAPTPAPPAPGPTSGPPSPLLPAWAAPAVTPVPRSPVAPVPPYPTYPAFPPPVRPAAGPVPARPRRRLSVARFYYAALAILGVVIAVSSHEPKVLIGSVACAAYSIYLFRGGRFVIWIW